MMENATDGLSQDSILPRECLPGVGTRVQPEKRLMLAVLEGAVSDFQKYATASTGRGRRIFADADTWFSSTETDDPLDFGNICHALALDPSFIRAGLHRWCSARRREHRLSRTVLHFPFRRVNGMRHTISAKSSSDAPQSGRTDTRSGVGNRDPADGSIRHQAKTSKDAFGVATGNGATRAPRRHDRLEAREPHPVSAWWSRGFACMKSPELPDAGNRRENRRGKGEMRG